MNWYRIACSLLCGAWTGIFITQLTGPVWAMAVTWLVAFLSIIGACVLAEVWPR